MANVVFLHPDLGIGGAERFIVDAAVALKERKYTVTILTNHHDPEHCFEETKNGLLEVVVFGDWLPRTIFGYCSALCAYIRMIYLALCFLLSDNDTDVIIIDQISIPIPLLKWNTPNIIFYCHFPDQLLSHPGGWLKKLYRSPLNWLEEYTTNKAKKVFVNSEFTAKIFMDTFRSAKSQPAVLYPSLITDKFDKAIVRLKSFDADGVMFLSLNRFERKKNIALAIHAFNSVAQFRPKSRLIVAGGYDENLPENVEYFRELEQLTESLNIKDRVEMVRSPSESKKIELLKAARCLIYTPENEHFGIVPLEAMYVGTPVLAANNGGPTETVKDCETGYVGPAEPEFFGQMLLRLHDEPQLAERLGRQGRQRVQNYFSFKEFTRKIDEAVRCVILYG